jgi:D-glycero-D-manno-heptose 1,7-bisphosphate phosphatase
MISTSKARRSLSISDARAPGRAAVNEAAGSRAAVFLDRDGVLTYAEERGGKSYAPRRLEDFRLLPGVRAAVERLRAAGYLTVVVTNQPDIANGLVDAGVVEAMHRQLREWLPLDAVEMCPHADRQDCPCRKPKPGLLLASARRLNIDLGRSVMVGDRWKDVEAGRRAGCRTVFVDRGYSEQKAEAPDLIVASLPAAVDWIVARGTTS